MGLGEDITIKKRKVIYDEYTGGFYTESKVESLQRQCDYRARLTDVINKAEDAKYRFACRQVDAEKQLFLMKKGKVATRHNDALQDHKAHMSVLERLAKERETSVDREKDIYGRYPPGSIRPGLEELIGNELKEMTPVVKRKREATKLLLQRNGVAEFDRTKTTDDIFLAMKNRKSRACSPVKTPVRNSMRTKSVPKLILPAITVRLTNAGDKIKVTDSLTHKQQKMPEMTQQTVSNESVLPSVFVTEVRGSNPPLR